MKVSVRRIRRIIETLQEIVDTAEEREVEQVTTQCNTYGLSEFVSCGYDGFLDLNADIDDLVEDPEFDDEM